MSQNLKYALAILTAVVLVAFQLAACDDPSTSSKDAQPPATLSSSAASRREVKDATPDDATAKVETSGDSTAPAATHDADSGPHTSPATNATPAATTPAANPDAVRRGKRLFRRKKCSFCHTYQGFQAKSGPNLSKIATKLKPDEMRRWITNPKAIKPDTRMPVFIGSVKQLDDIIAFLQTLK